MAVYQFGKIYRELPVKVKKFIVNAFFLFIGWLLVYHLILQPLEFPDRPLTHFIEYGTAKLLSLFYPDVHTSGIAVYVGDVRGVGVSQACNGLELLALYIGFLICLPTNPKRFLLFAIGGSALICVLNMARCATLAWMNLSDNIYIDFAHHYAFKLIIYGVVFYLWMIYSKKFNPNAVSK